MKIQAAFLGEDAVIKVSEETFKDRSESDRIRIAFQQRFQRKIHIVLAAWNPLGNDWNLAGPPDLTALVGKYLRARPAWTDYEM